MFHRPIFEQTDPISRVSILWKARSLLGDMAGSPADPLVEGDAPSAWDHVEEAGSGGLPVVLARVDVLILGSKSKLPGPNVIERFLSVIYEIS
jgi:hypothetical protein